MSTIQHEVVVKAIEIDLGDGDALFVNWDNVRNIRIYDKVAKEESIGMVGNTIPAKAAHVAVEVCYINDRDDEWFDSSLTVHYVKSQIRSEIERLNNGG